MGRSPGGLARPAGPAGPGPIWAMVSQKSMVHLIQAASKGSEIIWPEFSCAMLASLPPTGRHHDFGPFLPQSQEKKFTNYTILP